MATPPTPGRDHLGEQPLELDRVGRGLAASRALAAHDVLDRPDDARREPRALEEGFAEIGRRRLAVRPRDAHDGERPGGMPEVRVRQPGSARRVSGTRIRPTASPGRGPAAPPRRPSAPLDGLRDEAAAVGAEPRTAMKQPPAVTWRESSVRPWTVVGKGPRTAAPASPRAGSRGTPRGAAGVGDLTRSRRHWPAAGRTAPATRSRRQAAPGPAASRAPASAARRALAPSPPRRRRARPGEPAPGGGSSRSDPASPPPRPGTFRASSPDGSRSASRPGPFHDLDRGRASVGPTSRCRRTGAATAAKIGAAASDPQTTVFGSSSKAKITSRGAFEGTNPMNESTPGLRE